MSMYVSTVIHTPVIRKNFLFTLCTLNTVILYVTYNETMLAKEWPTFLRKERADMDRSY